MTVYVLKLVGIDDATGTVVPVAEYPTATVSRVRWVLNDIGEMDISLPLNAERLGEIVVQPRPPRRREFQLYRDGDCIWWGKVVAMTGVTALAVSFTLRSTEVYFRERRPGPAAQYEMLANPSFEDSAPGPPPTGWVDVTPTGSLIVSNVADGDAALGNQALLTAAGAGGDSYAQQVFAITAPASAPLRFEVSAWWRSYLGFAIGATYLNRGLFVARLTYPGAVVIDEVNAQIDPLSRSDTWHRVSVESEVPAGTTYYIAVRLYVADVLLWDAVSLRRKYATYTLSTEDRSVLAHRLVDQATGASQGGGPNGDLASEVLHPPLWIRWAGDNPTVGSTRPVYIDHDTAADFLTLLQDFPRLGLADFWVDPGDGTARTFRMASPRRGSFLPQHALEVGKNVLRYTPVVDGSVVADQLLISGADWCNTQPSPTSTDRDIWATVSPTPESDLNQIEEFRPIELARRARPCPVSSVVISASSPAALALREGDTVPVRNTHGWEVNETLRILARTLTPGAETMTYDLGLP